MENMVLAKKTIKCIIANIMINNVIDGEVFSMEYCSVDKDKVLRYDELLMIKIVRVIGYNPQKALKIMREYAIIEAGIIISRIGNVESNSNYSNLEYRRAMERINIINLAVKAIESYGNASGQ
jgi:hypothetical protein